MRKKLLLLLKIKASVLALLFVCLIGGMQTPWVKKKVAKKVTEELSKITGSTVSIKSYEAFLPLSFNFFNVVFATDEGDWLYIDQLSLNRSLLYFLFWENKGLDLSFHRAHLIKIPFSNEKKLNPSEFTWPKIPMASLNISLKGASVDIEPEVFKKAVPQNISLKTHLHFYTYGKIVLAQTEIGFSKLKGANLQCDLRANQLLQTASLSLRAQDPQSRLSAFLFDQSLPAWKLSTYLKGSPEALISFFQPQKITAKAFKGTLDLTLTPLSKKQPLWSALLDNSPLTLNSKVSFSSINGLSLSDLTIQSDYFSLKGEGSLDRNYQLQNVHLDGENTNLNFTQYFLKTPLEGVAKSRLTLSQSLFDPKATLELSSEKVLYKHIIVNDIKSTLSVQKDGAGLKGEVQTQTQLNQAPFLFSSHYQFFNQDNFNLTETSLAYGKNSLISPSFKKIKQAYLGTIDYKLKQLALFSPLLKQEVHGDIDGSILLDVDLKVQGARQTLSTQATGTSLQHKNLTIQDFELNLDGELASLDWKKFQGELYLFSDFLNYQSKSFENIQLYIDSKSQEFLYKLQTSGEFAISSVGTMQLQDHLWKGYIRQLSGEVNGHRFSLLKPTNFTYLKPHFHFSSTSMQVGAGKVELIKNLNEDSLNVNIEKFPVETLSYFIPKFDLRGSLDAEAKLANITSHILGNATATLHELSVEGLENQYPYFSNIELSFEKDLIGGKVRLSQDLYNHSTLEFQLPSQISWFPFKQTLSFEKDSKIELQYLGAINPFVQLALPENHLIHGDIQAQLKLKGPLEKPNVTGYLNLNNGYYENLFLGLVLKNMSFEMIAEKNDLILKNLQAFDDHEGHILAHGQIDLDIKKHMPFEFEADLQNAQIVQFDFITGSVHGPISLKGDSKRSFLKGAMTVTSAEVTIPNNIGSNTPKLAVTYLYPTQRSSRAVLRSSRPPVPMYFDVKLKVLNNTLIKGKGLNSSWKGDLHILGSDLSPKFEGKLESVEGNFEFAGRSFKLRSGTLLLNGHPSRETSINLLADRDINGYLINLNLKGPLRAPFLTFSSQPQLDKKDVLSQILFNQMSDGLTPFQAVSLTKTLSSLSNVYIGPTPIERLRKGIGLDQLTFGPSIDAAGSMTTVQVGKYISRNVLITLNRPVSPGPAPFLITAHFKWGFQFQTYFDKQQLARLQAQWNFSY